VTLAQFERAFRAARRYLSEQRQSEMREHSMTPVQLCTEACGRCVISLIDQP